MSKTLASPLALLIAAALATPAPALALSPWQKNHPGRTEVNARIARQQHRITQQVKEGDLTTQQAQALRAQDHSIRQQERADAQADGNNGHLTRDQIKALNGELNANSQAIGH
ncbi:MAG: hypothetical protein JSS36_12405 [Proteobacteria bacterium]|nr:hypothetical protein [Pseudomonadota bacterium]